VVNRLTSKLGRDLLRLRWQVASLAIVVASGVTIFVASISTYGSLIRARDDLYLDTRFPDVFVRLSRAPRAVADQLAAQSGVAAVEPRLTFDVPLDLPGVDEPIAARIVSLPPEGRAGLGRLVLRRGRLPGARERSAVAVSEAFAEARRLSAGDRITAVLDGRRQELTIVGVALSSEHVAAFQGGEVIPEDARFGILWLPYDAVAAAFHAESSFNEAVFALAPGAREEAVIADVDRVLAPYGGLGAHGRSEQRSSRFVGSELGELEVLATVLPVIFLAIATFLTNVVLARIVVQERTQIATLRALGFRVGTIARHYLAFALVIAGLGSTVGILLGVVLGRRMTVLYTDFFRFPVLEHRVEASTIALSVVVSLLASALGALGAVRAVARLAPAEAMQPAAPPTFERGVFERSGLARRLPPVLRLVVRSVMRRPGRTFVSSLGVGAAIAVLVSGTFWGDSLGLLIEHQFRRVQREDAVVTFREPRTARALRELEHVPGVRHAEGVRAVPVRLSSGLRARRVAVLGMTAGARLHVLLSIDGTAYALPPRGLVLGRILADDLGVGVGDALRVEVLEGRRRARDLPVALVVDELVGASAYLEERDLARLLGEAPAYSAALLSVERGSMGRVHKALGRLPLVAAVTEKDAQVRRFEESLAQIIVVFSVVLGAFGAFLVAGVVYNAARILASERERELATLRVLGFRRAEISRILLGELALQIGGGFPFGAAFGWTLASIAVHLFGPEDLQIPFVIGAGTWTIAFSVVFASAAASALGVRRRLHRLDLVAALKVRE